MPPSFFSPDTTWTGTQILLSEQHCGPGRRSSLILLDARSDSVAGLEGDAGEGAEPAQLHVPGPRLGVTVHREDVDNNSSGSG